MWLPGRTPADAASANGTGAKTHRVNRSMVTENSTKKTNRMMINWFKLVSGQTFAAWGFDRQIQ